MATYDLGKVVGSDGAKGDKGDKGDAGKGITSIVKTSSSGLVDTYTITFSDNTTTTFPVTNGSNATVDIVTSFSSTTSDSKVPSEKLAKTELDKKVAKSSTTGLLKNDGTVMIGGTGSSNWAVGNHSHYILDLDMSTPSGMNILQDGGNDDEYSLFDSLTYVVSDDALYYKNNEILNAGKIANNLTTTSSGKVLDARQGKALADLIGQAISYINQ